LPVASSRAVTERIPFASMSKVTLTFGTPRGAGIIAVGGDVPPELLDKASLQFPPVLFTRGSRDEWLTAPRFERDVAALKAKGITLTTNVYDAAHEWTAEVSQAIGEFLNALPSSDS